MLETKYIQMSPESMRNASILKESVVKLSALVGSELPENLQKLLNELDDYATRGSIGTLRAGGF